MASTTAAAAPPIPPTTTLPLLTSSSSITLSAAVGAPADAAAGSSAAVPLTLESLAAVVAEMSTNMAQMSRSIIALQAAWMGLTQQPPPPVSSLPPPPPPHSALPAPSIAAPAAGASPPLSSGLPLHMIRWPTSPSPIPEWALAGSAVVRLQAAARGLLARLRVRGMRDLQLIQPCTPSQLLQVVFAARRTSILSATSGILGMRFSTRAAISKFSAAVGEALPSLSFSIESPPHSSLRCRPVAVRRGEGMGSPARVHCLALPHSATGHREGVFAVRCGNHFMVATLMKSFRPDGVHGIQVAIHVQV